MILVAEDNADLLEVMSIFLALMGFVPLACCDGDVASAMYRRSPSISLLITDLEMPGRSGLELARELTALQDTLPVIIVSGAMLTDELYAEMRDRDWHFLAKPYDLPVLLTTVRSLIQTSVSAASTKAAYACQPPKDDATRAVQAKAPTNRLVGNLLSS